MSEIRTIISFVIAYLALGILVATQSGPEVANSARPIPREFLQVLTPGQAAVFQKGPVILYFTSTGCPIAAKANPYFDKISAAFKGSKVQFFGVVNADLKATKAWMKSSNLNFSALPDGAYKTIKAFGVKKAPACYLIDKGKIVRQWDGWSKVILSQIVSSAAKRASVNPPKINFVGAPSVTEVG